MGDKRRPAQETRSVRTAILGGTFDPVHLGHLSIAGSVAESLDYERVVFVPAWISPHKEDPPRVTPQARLEMVSRAIAGDPRFSVDRFELDRPGSSYTIDTVRHLLEAGDIAGRPGLIVGADLVPAFETWREVDELERLTDIILVRRPGFESVTLGRRHRAISNPEFAVSSTDIRERIRKGLPYGELLPTAVAQYIELNGLYR